MRLPEEPPQAANGGRGGTAGFPNVRDRHMCRIG